MKRIIWKLLKTSKGSNPPHNAPKNCKKESGIINARITSGKQQRNTENLGKQQRNA
jgi:hypothetical protein